MRHAQVWIEVGSELIAVQVSHSETTHLAGGYPISTHTVRVESLRAPRGETILEAYDVKSCDFSFDKHDTESSVEDAIALEFERAIEWLGQLPEWTAEKSKELRDKFFGNL